MSNREQDPLLVQAEQLTASFRAAGANAEPGLGGSVIIYADDEQARQILGHLRFGGESAAELITDLALVLEAAAFPHAGLRETADAALARIRTATGWTNAMGTNEITGRLAVALAQALTTSPPASSDTRPDPAH